MDINRDHVRALAEIYEKMWLLLKAVPHAATNPRTPDQRWRSTLEKIRADINLIMKSHEFIELADKLETVMADFGEGISQYAADRAIAFTSDKRANTFSPQFLREVENAFVKLTNGMILDHAHEANTWQRLAKEVRTQWNGKLISGLKQTNTINKVRFVVGNATFAAVALKGAWDIADSLQHTSDEQEQHTIPKTLIGATELVGGLVTLKWGLTGKLSFKSHMLPMR